MTKFTPGPWHVMCIHDIEQPEKNRRDCHCGFIFDSVNGQKTIGKVWHNDPRLPNFEPMMDELLVEEKNANANLIGAAPEMYEALQSFMNQAGLSGSQIAGEQLYPKARAALEKARGEE